MRCGGRAAFGDAAKAQAVVRHFVQRQIATSRATGVVDFFWKWHFPYNSNFQAEWSLKQILAVKPSRDEAFLVEAGRW